MAAGTADVITFTSPSTVRNFMTILDREGIVLPAATTVASIGPVTSQAARDLGLQVGAQARESTVPGLVDAIAEHLCVTVGRACDVQAD